MKDLEKKNPFAKKTETLEKPIIASPVTSKVIPPPSIPIELEEPSKEPIVILSETDAYIHERMKAQPKTMEALEIKVREDYDSPRNILALPKELESFRGKYAFRWLNKRKRAIDHAVDVVGWNFVNRILFPSVPKYLFTANGSIERGDAILAFMPVKQAEAIRLKPVRLSQDRVRSTPVQDLKRWEDRGEQYYRPDLGAAEDDNEKPRGLSVTPDTEIVETGLTEG